MTCYPPAAGRTSCYATAGPGSPAPLPSYALNRMPAVEGRRETAAPAPQLSARARWCYCRPCSNRQAEAGGRQRPAARGSTGGIWGAYAAKSFGEIPVINEVGYSYTRAATPARQKRGVWRGRHSPARPQRRPAALPVVGRREPQRLAGQGVGRRRPYGRPAPAGCGGCRSSAGQPDGFLYPATPLRPSPSRPLKNRASRYHYPVPPASTSPTGLSPGSDAPGRPSANPPLWNTRAWMIFSCRAGSLWEKKPNYYVEGFFKQQHFAGPFPDPGKPPGRCCIGQKWCSS